MPRAYLYASVPILFLFVLLSACPALAQFDTEYWMPPVWESRDDGPQRLPGSPVGFGGQTQPTELVITTAYNNAEIEVTLSNGTLVSSGSAQPGIPFIVDLTTAQGMTYSAYTEESDKGLRITSDFPVQVVYRNTSLNNQCLSPLKGTFALGTEFLAGSQTRVTNNQYASDDVHFISVMATEDNTLITFAAPGTPPRDIFDAPTGASSQVSVTLDKNETYLVRNRTGATPPVNDGPPYGDEYFVGTNRDDNLAGTRVTSDKPIAVMTGGQHLRYIEGTLGVDADAGIDQAVPIESDIFDMIGSEYVIVRGGTQRDNSATNDPDDRSDYAIVIATENNTEVRVNNVLQPVTLDAGDIYEYTLEGGRDALGTPFYIETTAKAYLYHVSGLRKHELGMSAVPTIDCAGSQYIAFNRFNNPSFPGSNPANYDNTVHVIGTATAFETLKLNGRDYLDYLSGPEYNFSGLQSVTGRDDWRTATFTYPKGDPGNLIIRSEGFFHLGVVVGAENGGTYGYLSSFARKVDVLDPNLFPLRLPTPIYRVGALAPGDTLTHCLELASCDPNHTIETITPSDNTGDAFRQGEEGTPEDICLQYVAKPDYLGNDTITVLVRNAQGIPGRVQLVFEVADFPQAVDDTVAVAQGGTATGNVLNNDRNVETGDFAEVVTDVQNGTATLNPDGTFTYSPSADFVGTDTLVYQVCDDVEATACSQATVLFRVGLFVDDVLKTTAQDQPVSFTATDFAEQFFDAGGSTLTTVQITSLPEAGELTLDGTPVTVGQEIAVDDLSSLVYTPPPGRTDPVRFGWNGSNGTTYAADPAEVIITLVPSDQLFSARDSTYSVDRNTAYSDDLSSNVNDPSGAGFTFTTDPLTGPQNGTIILNPDGTFTYTPNENFFGRDSVVYEVCSTADPTRCDQATAYFDVRIPEDDPTDTDDDGIPDADEVGDDQDNPVDTDEDGTPDYQDDDSDNDGIPDAVEAGDDPTNPVDTDNDGTPDYLDEDSDDDTIPDRVEAGEDPTNPVDTDDDGTPDYQDTNSDNDSLTDAEEAGPDPTNPQDTDDDGLPDYRDVDQGITIYEGFSPGGANDTWVIDGIQAFPNNKVQVFNRWGNKIYEVNGYDNTDRVWRGEANVSSIGGNEVPDGTYFYIIDLGEGEAPRTGYVVVNR